MYCALCVLCVNCDQLLAYCSIALIVHPPARNPAEPQWVDAPRVRRQGTPRARPGQRTNPRATNPTARNRRQAQRQAQRANQRSSLLDRCLTRLLRRCSCCCFCSSFQANGRTEFGSTYCNLSFFLNMSCVLRLISLSCLCLWYFVFDVSPWHEFKIS